MAETKKVKSIDTIANNPLPDASSRPLIMRSGPIMRDPSMTDQGNSDATMPKSEEGMISQANTIKISTIQNDDAGVEPKAEITITQLLALR